MFNLLEITTEGVSAMPETVAAYFTAIGQTITGMITSAANVFSGLWSSGVPGQVICSMGIASTLIGVGCALFRIRRGKKRP